VPLVHTATDAQQAVRAAHYPPQGVRGFAWQRGNDWGTEFDSYARNFQPLVIVMIESQTAVDNIDAIMAVDGVDACFVGAYDLSGSYGVVGQTSHPMINEACAKVSEACRKHGKAAGQHIVRPEPDHVHRAIGQGFTFLALGMDSYFLAHGARQTLEMLQPAPPDRPPSPAN